MSVKVGITDSAETMRPAVGGPEKLAHLAGHEQPVLLDMCRLLWPPPAACSLGQSTAHRRAAHDDLRPPETTRYVLVPGLRRPPLLVPADPHVAAAAVRHFSGQRSRTARLTNKIFSLCLQSGLGGAMFRGRVTMHMPAGADSIQRHLAEVLPPDIRVSMYLGPPRSNRKPVLQFLSPSGQAMAFAKVGVNALTSQLVRAEHTALTRLAQAPLPGITIPEVLHCDRWQGLDVLVLSALPAWLYHRSPSPAQLAAGMAAVARVDGLRTESLLSSDYIQQLRMRLADGEESLERTLLLKLVNELVDRAGGEPLTFGAWHGDWTPWNMASKADGLLVWDWERFTPGVPLGFDALHYQLQTDVGPGHRDPVAAATACLQDAGRLLAPFGVQSGQARITALLYLADLATRYLNDQQARAGAQYGDPGSWLIPTISREVARL
jgi:hypothetical protein